MTVVINNFIGCVLLANNFQKALISLPTYCPCTSVSTEHFFKY